MDKTFGHGRTVSVILSVKNGAEFLDLAIESLLQQSYTDLELILINDGSEDETDHVIQRYTDPRIVYVAHKGSLGLPTRLNEGVRRATGAYIARMDADDIALPTRIEKQVRFLETHPAIDLVGTWATFMDERGQVSEKIYRTPVTHEEILFRACFANPFIHPTMMVRAAVLKANPYDEAYTRSQDFELWSRMLFVQHLRAANIPEPLLYYRQHAASSTRQKHPSEYLRSAQVALQNSDQFYASVPKEQEVFKKAYSAQPLSLKEILLRIRFSVRVWKAFVAQYPEVKENIRMAPWKDLRFFTKYWIKQLIRPKKNTHVTPNGG